MLPPCFTCFCIFLSLGDLLIRVEAEGPTSIWACWFRVVSFTVIPRPFQSLVVALVRSSPNCSGDCPRRPNLRARADMALTSPPVHVR
ncbi:unnamed protein product [Gulo gulo]|uniref:Secreted protein n=1 Tax=Gulo gulo TaxID=48420 RepID=A0A9X9QAS8_GULGU|nr:unnamed protein product [Gulo gulo]